MKNFLRSILEGARSGGARLAIFEAAKIVVLALAIVVPIRYFIFQPFIVKGESMMPNFQNGNYLVIDELSYRFRPPARGEVIVLRYPYNPGQRYLKRIIGLPGETMEIRNAAIKILDKNGREIFLNETAYLPAGTITEGDVIFSLKNDEYFVLGDNRAFSSDSRSWGILPKNKIVGRVALRLWPADEIAVFAAPAI